MMVFDGPLKLCRVAEKTAANPDRLVGDSLDFLVLLHQGKRT